MKYTCYLFLTIFFISHSSAQPIGKLKVATYLEPPFVDFVGNEFIGEDIALIKALASAVNLKPEFLQCPFVRCLSMVKYGQADMMISVLKTEDRMKNLIYLKPAIFIQYHPIKFYLNINSSIKIDSYMDLSGLVIGTVRGVSYYQKFDDDTSLNKVETTNRQQLIGMLARNRIDTFLDRKDSITPLIIKSSYTDKFKLAVYSYEKPVEGFIVISKQSKIANYESELSNQLAKIIADKNNNKEEISNDRKGRKEGFK